MLGRLLCWLGFHRMGNEWVNCCVSDGMCRGPGCHVRIVRHDRLLHKVYRPGEAFDDCALWANNGEDDV